MILSCKLVIQIYSIKVGTKFVYAHMRFLIIGPSKEVGIMHNLLVVFSFKRKYIQLQMS